MSDSNNNDFEPTEDLEVNEDPIDSAETDEVPEVADVDEDVADEAIATKASTPRKKRLWIAAAVAAALVVGGAIATPSIVHGIQHSQASSAFTSGEQDLTDAQKELKTAESKLDKAKTAASERYAELKGLSDATPESFVADVTLLEEYKASLADYAVTAELTLDDSLNIVVPVEDEAGEGETPAEGEAPKDAGTIADKPAEKPKPIKTPDTVDELREDAEGFVKDAKGLRKDAAAANEQADAIESAYEPIVEQQPLIIESAHAKGEKLTEATPEKATKEAKAAFAAALAAIASDELAEDAELSVLMKTYVDTWEAVKASHKAAVAAEKKAAEEAQRKKDNANNPGNHNPGNHNPGNHNPGGGGPSNPGGGGGPSNPGGGTNPGGGGDQPSIPDRGGIVKNGSACQGSGGQASGNWTSNLVAPHDAGSVWVTSENRGSSWSIAWECDMGW